MRAPRRPTSQMKTIFELCSPRADVLKGGIKESDFAADLAQVLSGNAPREYADPALFFANTHPTAGLRNLLANVCRRLSGVGGEASSIFRLDTQYGGGKTHALIALSHAASGAASVPNIEEFLDRGLIPRGDVRVAAFDGENADPINGRPMGNGIRAFTPWGELAYALGQAPGYEVVRASDVERVAPGAETLRELFGGKPTLILLDELSIYLRKVKGRRDADQLTPFLTALFKAVESSPGAALVFTLAIGKGGKSTDAYSDENQWVAARLDEAESVAARKATLLDPTAESEVAQVLRRRLFERIDDAGAREIVEAYRKVWHDQAARIPDPRMNEDRPRELAEGYPFHPGLMSVLTDKLSTLANFQRVRGMLRLLTQAVGHLWKQRPPSTHAIHAHHLDPSFGPTRNEIVTRLEMSAFDPAIRNDVGSTDGGLSLAQQLDAREYAGMPQYATFVARTILWHTFAFNEHIKGITAEELRYSVLGPDLDPSFLDDARQKFVASSAYLDDRPAAPLRFLTEANLTMMIRRQESQVDPDTARSNLNDRIRGIFKGKTLNLVPFASGPYDVDDGVGDGRPYLVLLNYDAATVRPDSLRVPELVERIFTQQGSQGGFRNYKNNLVFVVADDANRDEMKAQMVRRLALEAMREPERLKELAEHQQNKLHELHRRSEQEVALAIQQCYRHLFFPTRNDRIEGAVLDLGHTAFDVQSASEKPGDGQQQVVRALLDNKKLLRAEDKPLQPRYVRDQTVLKRGQVTTADLRAEFRKEVRLPIMIGDQNFVALVRQGVEQGEYIYKSGDLLYGTGDPYAEIKIDAQSFVMTTAYATEQGIWPRAPKSVSNYPAEAVGASVPVQENTNTYGVSRGARHDGSTPINVPPPAAAIYKAEAPLREALTRIWEQARQKKVAKLASLRLRVFEVVDAFKLLGAVGAIAGAEKKVTLAAEYETTDGSSLELEFNGLPQDAGPLKEFLEPQFRAAKEKKLDATYLLTFIDGLALDGDAPEKLAEKLTRFATGAAFVEAYAEAKK
jgi:hypothetical protein